MIIVEINKKTIKLPSEYSEISLDKGLNINHIWTYQDHNLDTKKEILNILFPTDYWNLSSEKSIDEIISHLEFLNTTSLKNILFYKCFLIEDILYGMHSFEKITVREFLDLEFYLSYGDSPIEFTDKIAAILYRKANPLNTTLKNILLNKVIKLFFKNVQPQFIDKYEIEKYNEEDINKSELFRNKMSFGNGLVPLTHYLVYKEQLMEQFPTIYNRKNVENDPFKEQEDEYFEEHKAEIGKSFEENWGFYHVFFELVPNIMEREVWLDKDIKEFLKYLSYYNIKTTNASKNNQ